MLENFFYKYPNISGWTVEKKSGVVYVGNNIDPNLPNFTDFFEDLQKVIHLLIPWRKGPFVFGSPQNPIITINAEWQSQIKWNTFLQKAKPDFYQKVILDLGCNNGYYLFRTLLENPTELHGWDPSDLYKNQFDLLQKCANDSRIKFYKQGWKSLLDFPKYFDTILCFGILYHHTDPISILSYIQKSLKNKGILYLESLGINKVGSFALIPKKTYTNAKGMWFIPTKNCLENWLVRCGFRNIKVLNKSLLTPQEQRTTPYCPYPSFEEGMSSCFKKTIEGYPAPYRFLLQAQK